ncbi:Na(+)-translocating NADH-quinone reductase subunit A [bacterium SCSIO 12741]|nr:Na(+)-translocating NADH-quinone reductase subunit A [bacterium SCSIO 12741]
MAASVKIRKGVDIKLKGSADQSIEATSSTTFAVKPTDFHGLNPKLELKVGAEVKVGTALFHDKYNNNMKFVAPVSGELVDIVRGEKRRILEVRILADKEMKYESFATSGWESFSSDQLKEVLLQSGNWPSIRQRPYDVVADPADTPKAIFVSAFDSAPMAPDYGFILKDRQADLQAGVEAMSKLTSGKVHISTRTGDNGVFGSLKGAVLHQVSGPHPAGNVGVQIHHIDPINKGEKVWVINPQDLAAIGKFLKSGQFDSQRVVALTGSKVNAPKYLSATIGSQVEALVSGKIDNNDARIISGNVLTGERVSMEGYLGFYNHQISVIPEDENPEFFGWIAPGFDKFSLSRTFFSWLTPGKTYDLGTSLHGEERAFVMSGQYEKVFPFDIYPVYLLKAMLTKDIEGMENLGVYEVAPEDFALCEFACTSKIDLQDIVRSGLDLVKQECG